jgi:hypothetical protein
MLTPSKRQIPPEPISGLARCKPRGLSQAGRSDEADASSYGHTERYRSGVGRRAPTRARAGRPVLPQERIGYAQLCVSQHDFVRAGETAQFGRSMRSAPAGRRDDGQLGSAARRAAPAWHRASDRPSVARAVIDCEPHWLSPADAPSPSIEPLSVMPAHRAAEDARERALVAGVHVFCDAH